MLKIRRLIGLASSSLDMIGGERAQVSINLKTRLRKGKFPIIKYTYI